MRIKAFKECFDEAGLDCFIISDANNVYYLTGFLDVPDAPNVLIVPQKGDPTLLVPSLGLEEAEDSVKGCDVEEVKRGVRVEDRVIKKLSDLKSRDIGFDTVTAQVYLKISEETKEAKIRPKPELIWKLRTVKDDQELELMRRAARIADRGMEAALAAIKPGVEEFRVAAEAEYAMRRMGSEGVAFDMVVGSGVRSAYPHARGTAKRIKEGEFVVIDLGARQMGYRSDITRTVVAGRCDRKHADIWDTVLQAHEAAFEAIRAGAKASDVDKVARTIIENKGWGERFIHGLGHGVGLSVHEPPRLGVGSEDVLEEHNVVTDEPGVYVHGFGGVRIEDAVVVLKGRARRLTESPKTIAGS